MATGIRSTRLLEWIRMVRLDCRYYQASSSEMLGATPPPQNEQRPFWPRSPYGAAKVYACRMIRNYREAFRMFMVNGILFNHESPRRGEMFVTRKISKASRTSSPAARTSSTRATSTRSATGATPGSMSRTCG